MHLTAELHAPICTVIIALISMLSLSNAITAKKNSRVRTR